MTAPRPSIGRIRTPRKAALVEVELAGGLHAIAVRRPGVPLVELRIAFPLSGTQLSRPAAPVVLSESVLAGTDRHDREGLAAAVERLGGTLSTTLRGDMLQLSASALSKRLPDLLELVAEVLSGASYPNAEVRADRARTADQVMVLLSRPETIADEALARRLYGSHPYAAAIPRPDALLRVGAASLRKLHRAIFEPSSAHLVLVGDIQPKRALAATEDSLGSWLNQSLTPVGVLAPLPAISPGAIELVGRPASVQSNIRIGGPAPSRSQDDWPAASLANQLLGGIFTSRMVENLREKNGYTYSPRSGIEHGRAGSRFSFKAEVSTAVTAAALVEARYELGRIATTGVSDEEAEGARRYATGSFLLQTATQAGLASSLATWALAGTGPGYLASFPAAIARTTRDEIDEAARHYLAPSLMATVVVGDSQAVSPALALLDEVTASGL
ncbi:MAG: M16 family metallopeptidase [Acidimicrobiales bacterium]